MGGGCRRLPVDKELGRMVVPDRGRNDRLRPGGARDPTVLHMMQPSSIVVPGPYLKGGRGSV